MTTYTSREPRAIGKEVGKQWGANLVALEVNKDKSVTFLYDKEGERFTSTLQPCELKDYNKAIGKG